MQLQEAKQRFEGQGIKLAAISYDSPAILKDFAGRHGIEFPLLADPDSAVIRSFKVLNTEATGMTKGMAYPGFFFIDNAGVIREKFFATNYAERFTPNNVIANLFPELGEEVSENVQAPHLRLTLGQSDRRVVPGNHINLIAAIDLPADAHVYAPEVRGYKPIRLMIEKSEAVELGSLIFPPSKELYLRAIRERVPVFQGKFRIIQDIIVVNSREFMRSLGPDGRTIMISGTLQYQACTSKVCYPPTSVPVKWELQVVPLDQQRVPENIRHK